MSEFAKLHSTQPLVNLTRQHLTKNGLTELFTWRGAMALPESACFGALKHSVTTGPSRTLTKQTTKLG